MDVDMDMDIDIDVDVNVDVDPEIAALEAEASRIVRFSELSISPSICKLLFFRIFKTLEISGLEEFYAF